jgi:outer membrane receptor protein involved in Fe transport
MNKLLFIMLSLWLIFYNLNLAQDGGKIVGTLKDGSTGEKIPGCNIILQDLSIGAASDANGDYIILNVPPGEYTVRAQMVGYKTVLVENVKVISSLTTKIDFEMFEQAIEFGEVTVVDYKNPPVQKDLTSKIQARTAEQIARTTKSSVRDLVIQQSGIIQSVRNAPVSNLPVFGQFASVPTDGLHFRGGRENETLYLFDGLNVLNGLWGGYYLDEVPELVISSMETHTGTYLPKYGEAMSGVLNITPFGDIDVKPKFSIKGFTDQLIDDASHNTYAGEIYFSSALPFYNKLAVVFAHRTYSSDGYINGYIYPEYVDSKGQNKSGTPEKIPMSYTDTQFNMGKIIWNPITSLKLTLGGYISEANRGVYNHYFKYNPYGTPRVNHDNTLAYLKANYIVNNSSFVTLTIHDYNTKFQSRVYDDPTYYSIRPETGTPEFSTSGEDYVFFETEFNRQAAKLDYVWQINKIHNLSAGAEYDKLHTILARKNPGGDVALEEYDYKPIHISGYVNDKMEFEDMGMIINLGLRYDHIDTKRKVLVNLNELNNIEAPLEDAKPVQYISPRFGISFPVADVAAVRFGYGYYYQYPQFYKVFQGTFYSDVTGNYRPNPQLENTPIAATDIKPEQTINYEFGVQTMVSSVVSFDVTSFYRKTSNLVGVKLDETSDGKRFMVMSNIDYSTVKGIEFSLTKHFSNKFSAFFNYTYSKTLVSTSVFFNLPTSDSRSFPANWDQPHSFKANVSYEANNGFGFSIFGSYSSGFPYTQSAFNPNGERGPWLHQLDLNIFKNFDFVGFKQQFFIQITNLFDIENTYWVYSDSGIAGDDTNEATSHDYTNNPTMYGPGRTIQIGIRLWN